MPKLRPLPQPNTSPVTNVARSRSPNLFQKGHKRVGGRERGTVNVVTREAREAILLGLEIAGNRMGRFGIVSYVVQAALSDYKNGIALLSLITPRQIAASITKTETIRYESVADIAADLEKMGIRVPELFAADWVGDPVDAEVVEPDKA
jgi:hypothetical protein